MKQCILMSNVSWVIDKKHDSENALTVAHLNHSVTDFLLDSYEITCCQNSCHSFPTWLNRSKGQCQLSECVWPVMKGFIRVSNSAHVSLLYHGAYLAWFCSPTNVSWALYLLPCSEDQCENTTYDIYFVKVSVCTRVQLLLCPHVCMVMSTIAPAFVCQQYVNLCVCVFRCEVDLCRVPIGKRQLFTHTMEQGRGRLFFLVTITPCSGVSISDLFAAPLDEEQERENQLDNYVSTCTVVYLVSILLYYPHDTQTCPDPLIYYFSLFSKNSNKTITFVLSSTT